MINNSANTKFLEKPGANLVRRILAREKLEVLSEKEFDTLILIFEYLLIGMYKCWSHPCFSLSVNFTFQLGPNTQSYYV